MDYGLCRILGSVSTKEPYLCWWNPPSVVTGKMSPPPTPCLSNLVKGLSVFDP